MELTGAFASIPHAQPQAQAGQQAFAASAEQEDLESRLANLLSSQ